MATSQHAAAHQQHQIMGGHHESPQQSSQMMMSPHVPPMRTDRVGSHSFGGPGGLMMASLYQSMSPPQRPSPSSPQRTRKRSRPLEFDLGIPDFDRPTLDGMAGPTSLDGAYSTGQHGGMAASPSLPITHHHHLPDLGPHAKMLRRDSPEHNSISLVGQDGMPEPAPRPRGPKLKFTSEDDQLLIQLKEQKNLTWKQIADFFPGRSSGTLQVRYCTKLKAKTTLWTDDMDNKLRKALQDYENEKWRIVAHKVGSGFTPAACRERSTQLEFGDFENQEQPETPIEESSPSKQESFVYPLDRQHSIYDAKSHQFPE
ncbi:hypothetical protein Golomagni_05581 [Golovinomyces magnicellulatus]|nr:hypothetical protein Golomagni_05581 [Golovinomyces magnicellulatus]